MTERRGTNIVVRLTDTNAALRLAALPPRLSFDLLHRTHLRPDTIHLTDDLAKFIRERRQYAVGGVIGPADYLATTSFMVRPNDPSARVVPADAEGVKLMWDYYRIVRGPQRLRQLVTTNYTRSILTVFLKDANFIDTGHLMDDIRDYEKKNLAPHGITLGFAGDVAVSQSLIRSIVTTQLQSLLGSLAGILILTSVLGRSWRWGFYAVIPSTLAVAINFAVMGCMNIPLGVATSMFAGMTLGIGVDFATHVLEGCTLAQEAGQPPAAALRSAFARTGAPVLTNTLAVSLGFGILMFSQVPANARLGLLTVLGLVDCLLATLLLLPVLLHWWPMPIAARKTREPLAEPEQIAG
jgi:predicted RND superfamily exporter protein